MISNRGEITTAIVLGIAAASLLVGTLLPSLNPFNNLFGNISPSAANQKATWTRQTEREKPVFYKVDADTVAVGAEVERTYDTGTDERPVKLTLGQRIGKFFAGLTLWGLIGIVVSLVLFGGAPIVWIARKYLIMKQAFTNTVAAIRDLPEDTYKNVTPVLAAKQDKRDKKIIDKIKMNLH